MYAKIIDGVVVQFPYQKLDLRREYPNVSFPKFITDEILREHNVLRVERGEIPPHDERTHRLIDGDTPVLENGVWTLPWKLEEKSELEIAMEHKGLCDGERQKRNQLLAECDWTQGKDVPDSVSAEWAPYRQALRDVPLQAGFPHDIVWPKKPSESVSGNVIGVERV